MRLIDAEKFKRQVIAEAFTNKISIEEAVVLCDFIDLHPTDVDLEPDKHISKKPVFAGTYEGHTYYTCPKCGKIVGSRVDYCRLCGQELNWKN